MARVAFVAACLVLAAFAVMLPSASAAVLGIDFGAEFFKASVVAPASPFTIVENIHSKRKTPTVVSFFDSQRWFGEDALNHRSKSPASTFAFPHLLLGKHNISEVSAALKQLYLAYDLQEDQDRAGVTVKVGDQVYQPETLLAMILRLIRELAKAPAGGDVRDVVLTVPPFWAQAQRQALLDAADLAGLNVLALVHENTAAAVHYSLDRMDLNKTHNVLFYNLGSSSAKVSVVAFRAGNITDGKTNKEVQAETLQVLSHAWEEGVGGSYFDARIAAHLATEFNKKFNIDVTQNPKAMGKLIREAKRAKEVLSANKESPVFVESLINEKDLRTTLSRADLEGICSDLFDRLTRPMQQALEVAGLTVADLDAVELIGAGVRVPKVQTTLATFLEGKELSQHLNGDEAMALGSAFIAANLSTTFKINRKIGLTDVSPFAMGVRMAQEAETPLNKRASLFSPMSRFPVRKTVTFSPVSLNDVSVTLRYEESANVSPSEITAFNVSGLDKFVESQGLDASVRPRVSLTFSLNSAGVVSLAKTEATAEKEVEVTDEKKEEKKEEKKDDKKEESEEEKKEGEEEEKKEASEGDKKTKKIIVKAPLLISTNSLTQPQPLSAALKKAADTQLNELDRADAVVKETAQAKNTLESFLYSTRDKLESEDIQGVTTEEQREKLSSALTEAEDWLYEEEYSAADYRSRLTDLKALWNPMENRLSQQTLRPKFVEALTLLLNQTRSSLSLWETSKPWIKEEDKKPLTQMAADTEKWLGEMVEKQAALAAHEEPVLTSDMIQKKVLPLTKLFEKLSKIPKPKPVKPTKKSEEKKEEEKKEEKKEEEKKEEEVKEEQEDEKKEEDEKKTDL